MKWLIALIATLHGPVIAGTYEQFLSTLDISKPASLCLASERFRSEFGKPQEPGQPAAFFALWDFHERASRGVNLGPGLNVFQGIPYEDQEKAIEILEEVPRGAPGAGLATTVPKVWRQAEPWIRCGYTIAVEMGAVFLDPDPRFLLQFAGLLQPDCRAYLEMYLKESPAWLDYDGALAIPWDRLRSRIRRWERFRAEHSSIAELDRHIGRAIHDMMQIYLCGMDNSPVFEFEAPSW